MRIAEELLLRYEAVTKKEKEKKKSHHTKAMYQASHNVVPSWRQKLID